MHAGLNENAGRQMCYYPLEPFIQRRRYWPHHVAWNFQPISVRGYCAATKSSSSFIYPLSLKIHRHCSEINSRSNEEFSAVVTLRYTRKLERSKYPLGSEQIKISFLDVVNLASIQDMRTWVRLLSILHDLQTRIDREDQCRRNICSRVDKLPIGHEICSSTAGG